MALVGTNNETVICCNPEPTLISIDLNYQRVGFEAAQLLDRLMNGNSPPKKPIVVPPKELIARRSTDVYAVDAPLVSRALRFIAEHGHEKIRVAEVADSVSTTRRTLERRFCNVFGRTIAEELLRLRLEPVKRQLVESDEAIKTLARQSGFLDGKQMSKTFTRIVGVSPQQYRNQRRPA